MIWGCRSCGSVFDGPIFRACPTCGRKLPGSLSRTLSKIITMPKLPQRKKIVLSEDEIYARDAHKIGLSYAKLMKKKG